MAGSVASGGVSEDNVQVPTFVGGGGSAATSGSSSASCISDSRIFLQEVWQSGEPEMRPECGCVLIARPSRMAELETTFLGRALYVVIIGQPRSKVTPEALVAALEYECGNLPSKMKVETTLSLEGLPEEAWDEDTVNLVLAGVDGELIDMLPSTDKWLLHCTAWLRNPSAVPKVLTMSVPAPPLQPWKPNSDDENAHSPPRPLSPTDRGCTDFTVIMHVKEVIDLGPLLTEGLADEFLPDEGVDLTRRHTFATWRGKIDGTGPGPNGKA
ncbi:hypothetical protein ZWY2020_000694 [Hordeum vulgare]|nr:hypothetical protein ZWY2020_000694 [Hordeum vulgare]